MKVNIQDIYENDVVYRFFEIHKVKTLTNELSGVTL